MREMEPDLRGSLRLGRNCRDRPHGRQPPSAEGGERRAGDPRRAAGSRRADEDRPADHPHDRGGRATDRARDGRHASRTGRGRGDLVRTADGARGEPGRRGGFPRSPRADHRPPRQGDRSAARPRGARLADERDPRGARRSASHAQQQGWHSGQAGGTHGRRAAHLSHDSRLGFLSPHSMAGAHGLHRGRAGRRPLGRFADRRVGRGARRGTAARDRAPRRSTG